MKRFNYPVLFSMVLLVSCEKEEREPEVYIPPNNTELLVRTFIHDFETRKEQKITGVWVYLYASKEDAKNEKNVIRKSQTNSNAETTFLSLDLDRYYVVGKDPKYGKVIDMVTTPKDTKSFLDLLFPI